MGATCLAPTRWGSWVHSYHWPAGLVNDSPLDMAVTVSVDERVPVPGCGGTRRGGPFSSLGGFFVLSPDDPRHGTANGYNNLGCRCRPCTDAWNANHRAYMDRHPEQREKAAARGRKATAGNGGRSMDRWQPKGYPRTVALGRLHDRPPVTKGLRTELAIRRAVDDGMLGAYVIAEHVGLHPAGVSRYLRRMGLSESVKLPPGRSFSAAYVFPRCPKSVRTANSVLALLREGLADVPTIADRLGVTPPTVYAAMRLLAANGDIITRETPRGHAKFVSLRQPVASGTLRP